MPIPSLVEIYVEVVHDFTATLATPSPARFLDIVDENNHWALQQLAQIFIRIALVPQKPITLPTLAPIPLGLPPLVYPPNIHLVITHR